ncbi:hypothetical protein Leryth_017245 [Lithospermum erythrorhizon]|nr:hypothetical protein Leryth_017245 [Lithospermum erythrorhizon]
MSLGVSDGQDLLPGSSYRPTNSLLWKEEFLLRKAAMRTCATRVKGLPPGNLCRYKGVPEKKTTFANAIAMASAPKADPHPRFI